MPARELVVLLALAACSRHRESPPPAPGSASTAAPAQAPRAADLVPRGTVKIDGDWEEPDWSHVAWREQFKASDGQLARPSSEIRLLHDDKDLLVALYAADENIETRDAFDLTAGAVTFHVDVTGKMTPVIAGVRAKAGFDEGTLDNASDDDEEWVVEAAIPLALVGAPPLAIKASRCDVPKDNIKRCGEWAGSVRLE